MSTDTQNPKQAPPAAEEDKGEKCPDCGAPIRAKTMSEGGGVACTKCPWWFCY